VILTAADIQRADLSEPLVLFWHHHREGAWNKLATASLSFIPNMLSHLAPLSQFVATNCYIHLCLMHCSCSNQFSHTVFNAQISCLSTWSLNQLMAEFFSVEGSPKCTIFTLQVGFEASNFTMVPLQPSCAHSRLKPRTSTV